jgi:YidC/Oxa1 family membrane protein insertase
MSNTMAIYMPLLMGYMAYTLSSGLALYFFVSNVVGILQYAFLGKLNMDNLFPSRKKQIVKSK